LLLPLTSADWLLCVPPVILSVFSGTASFGANSPSTLVISSGGGASLPTDGISLAMVEVVLVKCGFKGFEVWYLRYSSAVSWARLFRASNSLLRDALIENGRVERLRVRRARDERRKRREDAIMKNLPMVGVSEVNWG
jgi:hypothetical protein